MDAGPQKPTIAHPVLGRLVGVAWDLSVAVLTLLAFPGYAWKASMDLVLLSPFYWPLVLPLLALSTVSVVFGVLWTFRRFHFPGGDDNA